jgi:hypothetical protein
MSEAGAPPTPVRLDEFRSRRSDTRPSAAVKPLARSRLEFVGHWSNFPTKFLRSLHYSDGRSFVRPVECLGLTTRSGYEGARRAQGGEASFAPVGGTVDGPLGRRCV